MTPQLMKSVSAACDRYCIYLEEEKKDKVQKEMNSKKQEMINELQSVIKENYQRMQDLIREFDVKFVNLSKKSKKTMILNSSLKEMPQKGRLNKTIFIWKF